MANDSVTPARLLRLGQGFMVAKTLLSAVELGIFTRLAAGSADAATLRDECGLHGRGLRDFLDALVALGLLERDEAGHYANTAETGTFLDRGKPSYIGGLFEMMNGRIYGFWGSLTEALAPADRRTKRAKAVTYSPASTRIRHGWRASWVR